jgi:MAP/microtubule affinity-regulating kinase
VKQQILRGILLGLSHCHSKKIIHRDLKPQNIIINLLTLKPKIIDLGLSLMLRQGSDLKCFKRCGTMGYIAPEVIANSAENRKPYGCKVDIFSFGIIAHMLLLGVNPLKGKSYE